MSLWSLNEAKKFVNKKTNRYVTQKHSYMVPISHDNSRIDYTGTWSLKERTTAIKGSNIFTSEVGATATLEFFSDFVGVVIEAGNSSGIIEIFIDGESQGLFDCYSSIPTFFPWVIFRKRLPLGKHTVQIKCTGEKNESSSGTYARLDHFFYNVEKQTITIPQQSGVILTFDDTNRTCYSYARHKLEEYGYKATCYINPGYPMLEQEIPIGGANDAWKVWWLRTLDYEITSHAWDHTNLTTLTEDEIREDFRKTVEWLQYHGFDYGHFAAPYNAINDLVRSVGKEFHVTISGGGGTFFDPNEFDCYAMPRYAVDETTDLNTLKSVLQYVKNKNKAITLYFHDVEPRTTDIPYSSISQVKFEEIIDYIASIDLKVMRMKDFLPLG